MAIANAPAAAPITETTTQTVAHSVDAAGHVFGQGGTDGLILYALILATFLMFLAFVVGMSLAFRAMTRQSAQAAASATQFTEASKENADALSKLASAIAAKDAGDGAFRAGLSSTMARVESWISTHGDHG